MRTLRFLFNLLVCAQSLNHVWLFVTLWTVARQAPLSMGYFRQEYQSGLSFPPPRDLLNPGIKALINLIEQFTELRETFYLVDHWFITKEYNSGTTKWVIGQHRGKRHVPLCSLSVCTTCPHPIEMIVHLKSSLIEDITREVEMLIQQIFLVQH